MTATHYWLWRKEVRAAIDSVSALGEVPVAPSISRSVFLAIGV